MNLRTSTVRALAAIGLLAVACWGIQDFNDTPQKVPDKLTTAAGAISRIDVEQRERGGRRKHTHSVLFVRIQGHPEVFLLNGGHPGLPKVHHLTQMLTPGTEIEVQYGPQGPQDIWALKVGGKVILGPDLAYKAHEESGEMGLVIAAVLLLLSVYLLWSARNLRRKEL